MVGAADWPTPYQKLMQRMGSASPEEAEAAPWLAIPADGSAKVDQRTSSVNDLYQHGDGQLQPSQDKRLSPLGKVNQHVHCSRQALTMACCLDLACHDESCCLAPALAPIRCMQPCVNRGTWSSAALASGPPSRSRVKRRTATYSPSRRAAASFTASDCIQNGSSLSWTSVRIG